MPVLTKFLLFLMVIFLSTRVSAGGIATLGFHMGVGANSQYFVGGTLKNTGDAEITKGYIVLLPVTERCDPLSFIFYEFGAILPGEEKEFRIPVTGKLVSYRLAGLGAVDDMGYALPVSDETAPVLLSRRDQDIRRCISERLSQAK